MNFLSCLDYIQNKNQINEGPHCRSISETAIKSETHKNNGIPKGISSHSKTNVF